MTLAILSITVTFVLLCQQFASTHQCAPTVLDAAPSPELQLEFVRVSNADFHHQFRCTFAPSSSTNTTQQLLYSINFFVTHPTGAQRQVKGCGTVDEQMTEIGDENVTATCSTDAVLLPYENLYGSNLTCQVQVMCSSSSSAATPESVVLNSTAHHFEFDVFVKDGIDAVPSGGTVQICVDMRNLPVAGLVTFVLANSDQQIRANSICKFQMFYVYGTAQVCQEIQVTHGNVSAGSTARDWMSLMKLTVAFASGADGIYTWNSGETEDGIQQIHQLQLKLLGTELLEHQRILLDTSSSSFTAKTASGALLAIEFTDSELPIGEPKVFTAVQHKMLPFEIQIKAVQLQIRPSLNWTLVAEVAIRYGNFIIRFFPAAERNFTFTVERKLTGDDGNSQTQRQLPPGMTLETRETFCEATATVHFESLNSKLVINFRHLQHRRCMWRSTMASVDAEIRRIFAFRTAVWLRIFSGKFDTAELLRGLAVGEKLEPNAAQNLFLDSYEMQPVASDADVNICYNCTIRCTKMLKP